MPVAHAQPALLALVASLLAVSASVPPAAAQFTIGGDPRVNPADFRITTFASGLNFPNGLALLSDGSLLVATSNPGPPAGFSTSTAELYRFVDANGDGVADGPGTLMHSDTTGVLTSLRVAYALAVRPAPGAPAGTWELYFNVGRGGMGAISGPPM